MDCSLSTWPSVTQFDDITWMGLGDVDPLESLDRNFENDFRFTESSFTNVQETKPPLPAATIPCNDTPAQISHTQSGDFYRLTSSESLVAARWESMNAVDLASVLDTFQPTEDPSTPTAEDMYDLYNDGILMQSGPRPAGDMDVFMSDSMPEVAEANTTMLSNTNVSLVTPDVSSLSSTQEDVKCEGTAGAGDSSASIFASQMSLHNPELTRGDCNAQDENMLGSGGGVRVNMVQPSNCFPFIPIKLPGCGDQYTSSQCALDLKESILPHRRDCDQPGMMIQWPKAQPTSANTQIFDREEVIHHSNLNVGDGYPATLDQQARLIDAAIVTSEIKRNRAQASRARRLAASQRRAKKYPLQKLIRMSSSPSSARDRLDQNLASSVAMLHPVLHVVSQNQQPLPRNSINSQVPGFLPVVLQGPNLASGHELLSHTSPVRGVPYYCYQQPSVAPDEDNRVSSGSSTVQSMCTEQDGQSLSTAPTLALSDMTNSTQILDAALLEQLQSILCKMNADMRLCIRDALYRLARSAKHRQSKTDNISGSVSSSSHSEAAMETNTNSIDRWIVNILFCKQPVSFEANSQSYPHIPSQPPNQSIESGNTNHVAQQWNSCGSSVNLHDRPLHVVTGL